jgi:hypothetical protein
LGQAAGGVALLERFDGVVAGVRQAHRYTVPPLNLGGSREPADVVASEIDSLLRVRVDSIPLLLSDRSCGA